MDLLLAISRNIMARLLLILCLAFSVSVVVRAQDVRLGVKLGGGVTTIVGPGIASEPKVLPLAGFVGGIYRTLPLTTSGRFLFQPELLYSQQGYRLSHPSTDYRATLRSSYVCLPLLFQFIHRGFFVVAGPQLGYLVGVREEYHFQSLNGTGLGVSFNSDPGDLPRWDVAAVAGAGYRWKGGVGVELRYAGGLTSVASSTGASHTRRPRNAGVEVQASYPLKGH